MSILSLYSKIQLKIGKVEKRCHCEEERRSNPDTTREELNHGIAASAFLSLRSFSLLAMTAWYKLQLLFWKTLKVIVRFFALLFNDSSENFLMFASEAKGWLHSGGSPVESECGIAKRLHSPKGTMEPACKPTITFVCNNSYSQYKKFQKRVRFFSKTAFAGILVCTVITSGVLYFMMPGKYDIKAATHSWFQTDWFLGADTGAVATHTSNQTGWTKFYSKDDNVNVGTTGEIKLTSTVSTIVEEDNADFNAGTQSTGLAASGDFYINEGNMYLKKADGASCSVSDECVGICSVGACDSCPTGYIGIPGNATFGTDGFCVMKYEAKNVGNAATSQAASTPWVNISQTAAKTACEGLGTGYHLITNNEWMTIARNIEQVAGNWSGGSVGSGYIYSGHNDNGPAGSLAASTDNDGYSGTEQTSGNQKRTLTLSNGEVIWDLAGNVWNWTDNLCDANWHNGGAWIEWSDGNLADYELAHGGPTSGYTSSNGIGKYYGCTSNGNAFLRGGNWNGGADAGAFALSLGSSPAYSREYVGFRCAR